MDKVIYKYELSISGLQGIEMPKNAEILSIQVQRGTVCIWALIDPEQETESIILEMIGTGHPINCSKDVSRKFVGTFQFESLVFHLFERKK